MEKGVCQELLDYIDTQVCYFIDEQTYGEANKAYAKFLGLEKEDLKYANIYDILDYKEADSCVASNKDVFEYKETIDIEKWVKNSKKEKRLLAIKKTPKFDSNGSIEYVIFSAEDITEKRNSEYESEKNCDVINNSPAVAFLWVNNKESGWPVEYVSSNVFNIIGYTENDFLSGKLNYADIIHPDDLERVRYEVDKFSNDPDCNQFQHEPYRIITKKGYVKWVDDRTHIVRDDMGFITHYQGIILDVTDRKIVENELNKKEKLLEDVFESIQDGISIVDTNFNVIRVNSKMKEWYADKLPLKNKKCYEAYHESDTPCNTCPTSRAFRTGETEMDIVPVSKGSLSKWLEVYSYPVVDSDTGKITSVVEFVRDITDKIELETELKKNRDILQNIIQSIPVGICMTDKNGYFESANSAYCETFGYDCKELIGNHFTIVVPERYKEELSRLHDSFIEGSEELSGEWPVIDKDGNQKTILANATKVHNIDNEPIKVTFVLDITRRKQIENQIYEYAQKLNDLNNQLETRVKEQTKKIEDAERTRELELHHRIKNNLQIISSLLSLQSEKFQDDDVKEAFEDMNNRVTSISLVHQKLYQVKSREYINSKDYIKDLVNQLATIYERENVSINIDVDDIYFGLDTIIPIGMIINELVSNSLKYFKSANERYEVTIKLCQKINGEYKLVVNDDGEGIPEHIDFDNPCTLGLQLVNSLVEQLGGKIELDRNNGTKFTINF